MIAPAMLAKSARLLAPLALAAVAAGVYLIVHSGVATHHQTVTHSATAPTPGHKRHRPRPKYYVVRPGDTLSAIAVKTHTSMGKILSLNPLVSPNSLQTGQRLRLRR
jgi:LysM repeat protein